MIRLLPEIQSSMLVLDVPKQARDMDLADLPWRSFKISWLVGLSSLVLFGCTSAPQVATVSPGQALLGKSKQEVVACAGPPLREIPVSGGIVLKYYKEASMFEESFVASKGSRAGIHHGCWANISISQDRVIGVEYKSVPTPGIADDHCDEIFQACVQ